MPRSVHFAATGDLLREQLLRVQLRYGAGAILWSITLTLDINLSPNGERGPAGGLEREPARGGGR